MRPATSGKEGMPRLTASRRRAMRLSTWASLLFAAVRLTFSPSASPVQPSRRASLMRAVRLSRISSSSGRENRRRSRMDQRSRERLPVLPALLAAVDQSRKEAAARLEASQSAQPGELFTAGGMTLRRSQLSTRSSRTWAEDPETGNRRDLGLEEDKAFWAWAAVEVLRGEHPRIEELTELSHHSLVQYRHPSTGQLIPLLHIAPSKTDQERLLVISPELADVLSIVLLRVRDQDGSVPLVQPTTATNESGCRRCR